MNSCEFHTRRSPDALPFLVDVAGSLAAAGGRLLAVSADQNPVDSACNPDLFLQSMNLEAAAADRKAAIKEVLEQGWHACDQSLIRGRP